MSRMYKGPQIVVSPWASKKSGPALPKISHSLRETSPSDPKVNVVMIEFQIAHQGAVTDAGITSLNLNGAMLI